jgi:hypothetical protein
VQHAEARKRIERLAVDAVLAAEQRLGREPREMPPNNPGYDIESRAGWGELLFIEVKGRAAGAPTVSVTKTEILTGLNKPHEFILALVEVAADDTTTVRYVRRPFTGQEDGLLGVASVNFEWDHFWSKGQEPS